MKANSKPKKSTETLVMGAILTALVVVLQYLGSFIHLGPFSISLVLLPIVIGAATCSTKISTWLGFVFGVVVLAMDASAFLAISVPGTVITVLAKGTLCGLAAGIVYNLVKKKNIYAATVLAAVICPVVNTGVFFLGCVLFFFETIEQWGLAEGFASGVEYMFIGLAGANFLVELAINLLLSPIIVRLLKIKDKNIK